MTIEIKNKPGFIEIDPLKILYNVGTLIDIPTGKYVKGLRGENILNGGLGVLTGIAGKANTYKSMFMHHLTLMASSRVAQCGSTPYISTYDTEMNISKDRLSALSHSYLYYHEHDPFINNIWSITDKTLHKGNEWYDLLRKFLKEEKIKNKKQYLCTTPMLSKDGAITTMFPTFGQIDSLSEFDTEDIEVMQEKNQIGEAGGNTMHMRLNLAKTRLLMELTGLCNSSAHYLIMTAHLGVEMPMQGPMNIPTKKLPHMNAGSKFKGVSDKFYFLPTHVWETVKAGLLLNQTTKGPEFPLKRGDSEEGSKDLNYVTVRMLRSKTGVSGFNLDLIVSQNEGILSTLSEFYFLKENSRYGLEGSDKSYSLSLLPEVKLQRTTVREAIDTNALLRRAIKITADLLQIKQYMKYLPYPIPEPKVLYDKLSKEYDWTTLLQTRDYWTFNQYEHESVYLSTLDMIEMYHGLYIPYWKK